MAVVQGERREQTLFLVHVSLSAIVASYSFSTRSHLSTMLPAVVIRACVKGAQHGGSFSVLIKQDTVNLPPFNFLPSIAPEGWDHSTVLCGTCKRHLPRTTCTLTVCSESQLMSQVMV